MHRGLLEEEKERQADTCSVSTRRRRDPGNSRRPLVSDLQMCKDWQRARLGSSPKFGSGCAEFPASGRSVHETVGLCVSWGEEAEVVALGPDRRLQGAFENETVRTFLLCHLVRVFVASQSQVVTAPHAQLPILVQEEAGRGKWEGVETGNCIRKVQVSPRPSTCVLLGATAFTATHTGKAIWGAHRTSDPIKVLFTGYEEEWVTTQ